MIDLTTLQVLPNLPEELLSIQAANKLLTSQNEILTTDNNNLQMASCLLGAIILLGGGYFIWVYMADTENRNIAPKLEAKNDVKETESVNTLQQIIKT